MATTDFSAALKTATGGERARLLAGRYAKVQADDNLRKLYGEDALSKEYLDSVRAAAGSSASVPSPTLRSAQELAELYGGVNYDMDAIRGVFDKQTAAEYEVKRKQYKQTEDDFYGQMYNAGVTAQDALRKNTAAAITTGASRGMQAATELSALLGLQQESAKTATDLATARNLLTDQEQAAYMTNATNALTSSNDAKLKLGTLGGNLYAADTQFSVGQMSALAAEQQAKAQLQAAGITADGNVNAAKATAAGNIGAANAAGSWNLKATERSSQATETAAAASASATRAAAAAQAQATLESAYLGAEATKAAARTQREATVLANPTLQTLIGNAVASGNIGVAAALMVQATGGSLNYADALKAVQAMPMPTKAPSTPPAPLLSEGEAQQIARDMLGISYSTYSGTPQKRDNP